MLISDIRCRQASGPVCQGSGTGITSTPGSRSASWSRPERLVRKPWPTARVSWSSHSRSPPSAVPGASITPATGTPAASRVSASGASSPRRRRLPIRSTMVPRSVTSTGSWTKMASACSGMGVSWQDDLDVVVDHHGDEGVVLLAGGDGVGPCGVVPHVGIGGEGGVGPAHHHPAQRRHHRLGAVSGAQPGTTAVAVISTSAAGSTSEATPSRATAGKWRPMCALHAAPSLAATIRGSRPCRW